MNALHPPAAAPLQVCPSQTFRVPTALGVVFVSLIRDQQRQRSKSSSLWQDRYGHQSLTPIAFRRSLANWLASAQPSEMVDDRE